MTDQTDTEQHQKEAANPDTSDETKNTDKSGSENMIPQHRFNEVNNSLKKLQTEFDEMRLAQQKSEEEALAVQGKWQEIAEARAKENVELKAKAQKLDEHTAIVEDTLKSRIAQLPEDKRKLVETLPDTFTASETLKWINSNQAILSAPPPAGDWGDGQKGLGNGSEPVRLEDGEAAAAKMFGMSEKDYAKYRGD